jgi:hypothetical protein
MSRLNANTTRAGVGIVYLRSGKEYEGELEIVDGMVHFDGERRLCNMSGVSYYYAEPRTWSSREVTEIRWLERYPVETVT